MPRITVTGYRNFDTTKEPAGLYDRQGGVRHTSGEVPNLSHFMSPREEEPSAGTSSSTSESKPEPSGSTAPETESSTQSPAQDVGSPSGLAPQANPALSSTASSTDGSGQGTGPDPALQPDSSEESAQATPATPVITDEDNEGISINGAEALHLARKAFDDGDYDLAEDMLKNAEAADPGLAPEVKVARSAIDAAKTVKGKG